MPGRTHPRTELSPIYRAIGAAIRVAREEAELSQQDLARAVRVSRTSITNLEAGTQQVPLHTLYEIAAALNIDIRGLLPDAIPTTATRAYGNEDVSRWANQLQSGTSRRVST